MERQGREVSQASQVQVAGPKAALLGPSRQGGGPALLGTKVPTERIRDCQRIRNPSSSTTAF